jgi:hypothetical protein
MGDAALGKIRIVVPVKVPRGHSLHRIGLPDAPYHVAAHGISVKFVPVSVQEINLIIFLFSYEGGHGGALYKQFALESSGTE